MSFEQYSVDLSRKPYKQRSNGELTTLLGEALDGSQTAWQELWEHGLRMVLKIVNKLEEKELLFIPKEEAIGVGNLAIGQALATWLPKKGSFATWIWVNVRREITQASGQEKWLEDSSIMFEDLEGDLEAEDQQDLWLFKDEVWKAIRELPKSVRDVIVMVHLHDMSQSEVAELKGVTRQRVNTLHLKGLSLLRDSLKDYYEKISQDGR